MKIGPRPLPQSPSSSPGPIRISECRLNSGQYHPLVFSKRLCPCDDQLTAVFSVHHVYGGYQGIGKASSLGIFFACLRVSAFKMRCSSSGKLTLAAGLPLW
jgi:hypothetical protein